MITVGFGEIHPVNMQEQCLTIIITMVSCGIFAYCINQIGATVQNLTQKGNDLLNQICQLNTYLKKRKITNTYLLLKIKQYYQYLYEEKHQEDHIGEQVINSLIGGLKKQVMNEIYGQIIRQHKFFSLNFSKQFIEELSLHMEEIKLAPQEIIQISDDQQSLFFLISGTVHQKSKTQKSQIIRSIHQQEIFNETEFISGVQRSKSFYITEDVVQLGILKKQNFKDVLKMFPEEGQQFYQFKENIIQNITLRGLGIKCQICQSFQHDYLKCPFTFFVVNKPQILNRYNKDDMVQERIKFKRYLKLTINSLFNTEVIRDQGMRFILTYNSIHDQQFIQNLKRIQNAHIEYENYSQKLLQQIEQKYFEDILLDDNNQFKSEVYKQQKSNTNKTSNKNLIQVNEQSESDDQKQDGLSTNSLIKKQMDQINVQINESSADLDNQEQFLKQQYNQSSYRQLLRDNQKKLSSKIMNSPLNKVKIHPQKVDSPKNQRHNTGKKRQSLILDQNMSNQVFKMIRQIATKDSNQVQPNRHYQQQSKYNNNHNNSNNNNNNHHNHNQLTTENTFGSNQNLNLLESQMLSQNLQLTKHQSVPQFRSDFFQMQEQYLEQQNDLNSINNSCKNLNNHFIYSPRKQVGNQNLQQQQQQQLKSNNINANNIMNISQNIINNSNQSNNNNQNNKCTMSISDQNQNKNKIQFQIDKEQLNLTTDKEKLGQSTIIQGKKQTLSTYKKKKDANSIYTNILTNCEKLLISQDLSTLSQDVEDEYLTDTGQLEALSSESHYHNNYKKNTQFSCLNGMDKLTIFKNYFVKFNFDIIQLKINGMNNHVYEEINLKVQEKFKNMLKNNGLTQDQKENQKTKLIGLPQH